MANNNVLATANFFATLGLAETGFLKLEAAALTFRTFHKYERLAEVCKRVPDEAYITKSGEVYGNLSEFIRKTAEAEFKADYAPLEAIAERDRDEGNTLLNQVYAKIPDSCVSARAMYRATNSTSKTGKVSVNGKVVTCAKNLREVWRESLSNMGMLNTDSDKAIDKMIVRLAGMTGAPRISAKAGEHKIGKDSIRTAKREMVLTLLAYYEEGFESVVNNKVQKLGGTMAMIVNSEGKCEVVKKASPEHTAYLKACAEAEAARLTAMPDSIRESLKKGKKSAKKH